MIAIKISSAIELIILTTTGIIVATQIFFHMPFDPYIILTAVGSIVLYGTISAISLVYLNKKAQKCSPKHKK